MNIEVYKGDVSLCINAEQMALLLIADPDQYAVNEYLKDATILIAKETEELLAIAVLTYDDKGAELKNIVASNEYQGKGFAKSLITEAKHIAKATGEKYLLVGTGNSSIDQIALYQKCGFRLFEVIPDFFNSYPETIFENGIQCIDRLILRAEL